MTYTQEEKRLLDNIKSNIEYHNTGRRKNRLSIQEFIADGNRITVYKDGRIIADVLTIKEAFYFIFGFIRGMEK